MYVFFNNIKGGSSQHASFGKDENGNIIPHGAEHTMSTVSEEAIHTPILTRMNMAMKMITIMTMSMDAREAVTPAAAASRRLRPESYQLTASSLVRLYAES